MILRTSILTITLLFNLAYFQTSSAQQWNWAVNATGDSHSDHASRDIASDHNGNHFIAGYFTKTMVLGSFTLVNPDDYYSDMYLARIDSSGNVVWAKSIELFSTYNDDMGICLDDAGNIYLTGAYDGRMFIHKYDFNGNLVWNSDILQKNIIGFGSDIAIDQSENVFITGTQDGSLVLAKVNSDGKFVWLSRIQGCHSNGCFGHDLTVDRLGNCYVAGGFSCSTIAVGDTVLTLEGSYGDNIMLLKYSSEGVLKWVKQPRGRSTRLPQVALTDAGHVILAGNYFTPLKFNDSLTLQLGPDVSPNTFLASYDTSGNLIWAKEGKKYYGGPRDIVVDLDENIYLAGTSFGNWGGTEMDFHITKYNPQGDTIFRREVFNGNEYLYGLDIDNAGNIYAVGHADIGGVGIFGIPYANPSTIFFAKLNTGSTTRRRTIKPVIEKLHVLCPGNVSVPLLTAQGVNVKWYNDKFLNDPAATGNNYQSSTTITDTLYVTQTIDNVESWPKEVVIYFSNVDSLVIESRQDSLFVNTDPNFTYQWYRDSTLLTSSQNPAIKPDEIGLYSVRVNNLGCVNETSYFYYKDLCPGSPVTFISNLKGYTYRWQVSTDNGVTYTNLNNNINYSGVTKDTLNMINAPASWRDNKYRCVIESFRYSDIFQFRLHSKWTGAIDNNWDNPGNWSCGVVPGMYTDILIDSGEIVLNTNTVVRTLRIMNGASLIVNPGVTLTILH